MDVTPRPPAIVVTVDDVVLHGISPAERDAMEAAIRAHLQSRFADDRWRSALVEQRAVDVLDGGRIGATASAARSTPEPAQGMTMPGPPGGVR